MQPNIEISNKEERGFVLGKLVKFNTSKVLPSCDKPITHLSYVIKDNGQIVAGLNAELNHWRCLFIDILWVDESCRKSGYGSALLNKVESEAKAIGSHLAHLDTYDFQAKDFYIRNGYTIFGTLEDCPSPGHRRYYLQKKL